MRRGRLGAFRGQLVTTELLKRGQILLRDDPQYVKGNALIFAAQHVLHSSNFAPWNFRVPAFQRLRSVAACFRDDLNSPAPPPVSACPCSERLKDDARRLTADVVNGINAVVQARRCRTCGHQSDDLHRRGLDPFVQRRMQATPGRDVGLAPENPGGGLFHVHQSKQAQLAALMIEEQVNVGFLPSVGACRRAEQLDMLHAELNQLFLVRCHTGNGLEANHGFRIS